MGMSRTQYIVVASLILLFVVAIFSSDSYLPSLPAMTAALHATHREARLSISLYMLGFGLFPLAYGPLSDRYGRKRMILLGLSVAIVGSVICATTENIWILILGRFIQGAGTTGGMSLSRTMISDVFKGKQLAQVGSYMGMMIGVVPAIAPTVGGYIQHLLGWRANFILLLIIITFAFLWTLLILPETAKEKHIHATRFKIMLQNYLSFLKNKSFIVFPLCAAIAFSTVMCYITVSPFLFQTVIGLSPIQYGWLAFTIGAGIMLGSFFNSFLVKRFALESLLLISAAILTASSAMLLFFGLIGVINVAVIIIPIFILVCGTQLCFANAFSAGMGQVSVMVGIASALYSTIQMAGAAVSSFFAATVHVRNQVPLGLILLGLSILFFALVKWVILSKAKKTSN